MLGMLVPGIMANICCVYARTIKFNEYQAQIQPLYSRELSYYKRFFHEEDYDEYK